MVLPLGTRMYAFFHPDLAPGILRKYVARAGMFAIWTLVGSTPYILVNALVISILLARTCTENAYVSCVPRRAVFSEIRGLTKTPKPAPKFVAPRPCVASERALSRVSFLSVRGSVRGASEGSDVFFCASISFCADFRAGLAALSVNGFFKKFHIWLRELYYEFVHRAFAGHDSAVRQEVQYVDVLRPG